MSLFSNRILRLFTFILCSVESFRLDSKVAVTRKNGKPSLEDDTCVKRGENGHGLWIDFTSVQLVITGTITSSDFLKLMNAAENPVGITGDQSFIESVYLGKIPWYETMAWKHEFYNGFKSGIASAQESDFMTSTNARNLTEFMDLAPQEPNMSEVDEWDSNRTVRIRHVRNAMKEVALFKKQEDSLKKAVDGMRNWITMNKNVKAWLRRQMKEKISWDAVLERPDGVYKVLLFMENMIGFGNTVLLQRIESEVKTLTFEFQGKTVRASVRCVVTTMDPDAHSEGTPEKIKERHPEWIVPTGDRETQLHDLLQEADSFQPDIAIVAPASSYHYDVREDLYTHLQKNPKRPVLWLGEYDHGESAEESGFSQPMWPLGLGEESVGIVVPSGLQEKLDSPWVSDIAMTLASVKHSKKHILLFAYLHTEEAVRDYLLLAKRLSKVTGKQAIVVMPRMNCVPKDEEGHVHKFRNMVAMLQRLIHSAGPFAGSLKVIRAESGDRLLQWNAVDETCERLSKANVSSPQVAVSSSRELREALGLEKEHMD